jgi:hypothetical protein
LDLHVAAIVQITQVSTAVADAAAIFLEMGGDQAEVACLPIAINGIRDQLHQVAAYLQQADPPGLRSPASVAMLTWQAAQLRDLLELQASLQHPAVPAH